MMMEGFFDVENVPANFPTSGYNNYWLQPIPCYAHKENIPPSCQEKDGLPCFVAQLGKDDSFPDR